MACVRASWGMHVRDVGVPRRVSSSGPWHAAAARMGAAYGTTGVRSLHGVRVSTAETATRPYAGVKQGSEGPIR
jgi:hypothetical protein